MDLIKEKLIPLDKSWIIRMGVLDLINEYDDIIDFLDREKELNGDLFALRQAVKDWYKKARIYVGESGTLLRFLRFISWKYDLDKDFVTKGTLKRRKINTNPEIVNWPLVKLIELDHGTSQWASAAVLTGRNEKIKNPPFKLKLTFEALDHWNKMRGDRKKWEAKYDDNILRQANAFMELLKGKRVNFKAMQAEDYCFARAFGFISKEEGEEKWPSLRGHESNRVEEMEKEMKYFDDNKEIKSKDHRVVQAMSMLAQIKGKNVKIAYPESVNKSWPQFWKFVDYCSDKQKII